MSSRTGLDEGEIGVRGDVGVGTLAALMPSCNSSNLRPRRYRTMVRLTTEPVFFKISTASWLVRPLKEVPLTSVIWSLTKMDPDLSATLSSITLLTKIPHKSSASVVGKSQKHALSKKKLWAKSFWKENALLNTAAQDTPKEMLTWKFALEVGKGHDLVSRASVWSLSWQGVEQSSQKVVSKGTKANTCQSFVTIFFYKSL